LQHFLAGRGYTIGMPPNNSMQRTALRAAADARRYAERYAER
jgi:hypothetical protein